MIKLQSIKKKPKRRHDSSDDEAPPDSGANDAEGLAKALQRYTPSRISKEKSQVDIEQTNIAGAQDIEAPPTAPVQATVAEGPICRRSTNEIDLEAGNSIEWTSANADG